MLASTRGRMASIRPYNQPAITKNPADVFKGVRRIYFYSASTA